MTNEQKIHCYKNLAICHENYHPGNHIIQAEICRSIVKLAPREKSDSTLYGVMLKAKHLRFRRIKIRDNQGGLPQNQRQRNFQQRIPRNPQTSSRDYYRQTPQPGKRTGRAFEAREKSFRTAYYLINETGLDPRAANVPCAFICSKSCPDFTMRNISGFLR